MVKLLLECLCMILFCVFVYYAFWIGCALDDVCFYQNAGYWYGEQNG